MRPKAKEHALSHAYLDGRRGLEIGASAHNPFGLNTRNVDLSDPPAAAFVDVQIKWCGEAARVDIVAPADHIPVPDASEDFVLSSHVLEHVADPIGALLCWYRVVRPGGHIVAIIPRRTALPSDVGRPVTTIGEMIRMRRERLFWGQEARDSTEHLTVWTLGSFWGLVLWMREHYGLSWGVCAVEDPDRKVGNGFAAVIRKAP